MALLMNVTLNDAPTGIPVPTAYVRVTDVTVTRAGQATISLDYWASEAVYRAGRFRPWRTAKLVMDTFNAAAPVSFRAQLYAWLKTQPEFTAAQDV